MFISIISWMAVICVLHVNGHRCSSDEHLEYALSHDPEMRGRLDALNFWVNAIIPEGSLGWTWGPGVEWKEDGVVQIPFAVGSKAYDRNNQWTLDSVYNLGRTATHEIGHWLNLQHIWGNPEEGANGCSHDDHVSDTPVDDDANYGCPADGTSSCGTNDMYMNFMDYTNDNCMNMFTIGQVDRGDDLFLAGGRREKLLDYVKNPTNVAFIDYFYFVNGNNAQCDNGHTRRDLNLNEGAGGDFIYLCISYSRNPYVDVITDIDIKTGGSSGVSCNSGYEKIDSNLNEDAGAGADHIYVCYKKESRQTSSSIITDLYPFAFDSAYSSSTYNGYTLESVNLNKGAGGKYIYLGFKVTTKGNGQSSAAKSVHEHVSYHPKKYDNMKMYYGPGNDHKQYPNYDDWMDSYHGHEKDNYNNINNNDMNGTEISTHMLKLIIGGLMIINIVCLGIHCMNNNKCKLNKKQREYKVVKYESEDTEV